MTETTLLPTARPVVFIPTYNESASIISLIDEILALPGYSPEILVIDDASPDGTADLVEKHPSFGMRLHLLKRNGKLGLGTAYRDGYAWGIKNGYSVFVQIDADHSHDPRDIPLLLKKIDEGYDCVIGSRYINGVRVLNWPLERLFLSSFSGFYTRLLTGIPLTDPTSGFKAVRAEVAAKLPWKKFTTNGYCFQIELHYFLWKLSAKIQEIPIIFTERQLGRSKMSLPITAEAAKRVITLKLGL